MGELALGLAPEGGLMRARRPIQAVSAGGTATPVLEWYKKQAPDGTWYKTQAASPGEAKDKLSKEIADAARHENEPSEEDDMLTGFDYLNGSLETLSGDTFSRARGRTGHCQHVEHQGSS